MQKRVFGFDLGIASIGWAVVEFDKEYYDPKTGEVAEGRIIGSGVRCFPVAENPKDGSSLASPRREKRLARRICRRKARRMQGIKKLFIAKNLVKNMAELETLYAKQDGGDVWDLRIKALSEQLSKSELIRVLTHLAKHRGFKSYRQAAEENDKEGGKVLKAIRDNRGLLKDNKTLAQIIVERAGKNGKKRNYTERDAKGIEQAVYNNSIPREEIIEETKRIFQVQKIFTQDLFDDFSRIAFRHRPVAGIEKMVGYCRFEKGEKRAPKEAPTAETFVALSKINNMKIKEDGEARFLIQEEREKLLELLQNTQKVKYTTISKKIFSGKDIEFCDIDYKKTTKKAKDGSDKTIDPEDVLFYEMKGWHKLKSKFTAEEWNKLSSDIGLLDNIVKIIAYEKNDEAISEKLSKEDHLSKEYIAKLTDLSFDKFINLSVVALNKIIPFMLNGDKYNEACEKAGYDFKDTGDSLVSAKGIILEAIASDKLTTVPVVNRTISQFRKVYNAMVKKFGQPDQINIETGRDLKKSFDERKKIEKKNNENREERNKATEELLSKNIKENSTNILKYRLYQEQHGKCIYSGHEININRLDEEGYLDIDHIIPYSRSLDNSYNNKVLCLSSENRMKGNKTPFEYIKDETKWGEFKARVKTLHNHIKEEHLLDENFIDRELKFRERNSNDNNHIACYIKKYLEDGIDFSQSPRQDIKNRIQMRTGSLTGYLRHCWGLKKDRNENDLHHAQDAIVIACATQRMVQYLSTVSGLIENKWQLGQQQGQAWYNTLKYKFVEPWPGFREEVEKSVKSIFVSRPSRKKAAGEIHEETIRTLNPNKPKYNEKEIKSGILVRGGLAHNGAMLRTDVFVKKNKKDKDEFYLVPIYLSDMGKELPNKAIKPNSNEWITIDEAYEFKFSIYLDDLIKVTKDGNEIFGYFKGTDRNRASIEIEPHDRSSENKRPGVKTQDKIQKYMIDPLGKYTEIKKESRVPLNKIKSNVQRDQERMKKKKG